MTEQIFTRDAQGALVLKSEAREGGKSYADLGGGRLLEQSDAAVAERAAHEQRWRDDPRRVPRKPDRERIADLEEAMRTRP